MKHRIELIPFRSFYQKLYNNLNVINYMVLNSSSTNQLIFAQPPAFDINYKKSSFIEINSMAFLAKNKLFDLETWYLDQDKFKLSDLDSFYHQWQSYLKLLIFD